MTIFKQGVSQDYQIGGTDIAVTDGGTGASSAAGARENLSVPSRFLKIGDTDNLGISYASGTFSITQANGSALVDSDGNRGYVCVPSTTAGQNLVLSVTGAIHLFTDDAHASDSDIVGEEFGVTTGVAWAQDRPFYIYAVNADNTAANLKFAISPNPAANTSPATTNIGYADNPAATPSDLNFFFLTTTNVTATHNEKPCICVGSFRMRMTSSDDWTVQTLSNSDGIGKFHEATSFTFPNSQMGAASGKYLADNGGTAPVFNTNTYTYKINREGKCMVSIFLDADAGTDGSGAVTAQIAAPYRAGSADSIGTGYVASAGYGFFGGFVRTNASSSLLNVYTATQTAGALQSGLRLAQNGDFTNGSRLLWFSTHYNTIFSGS